MKKYKNYIADQNGNFGTIFAIVLVPLLLGIGVAVDMSRISSYHTKLQDTADTAVLDAALAFKQGGEKTMRQSGRKSFKSHADTLTNVSYTKPRIVKTNKNTVIVTSQGSFEPIFPQLFGYPKLDFDVSSEASLGSSAGVEISIAFDSTYSMSFNTRWQNAIATMRKTLEDMKAFSGTNNFYITLVPFEDRINLGNSNTKWTKGALPTGWEGCVEPRENGSGVLDDKKPRAGAFVPSIPKQTFKYSTFEVGCPAVPITGPTNSVEKIITAVNQMQPGGTGRIDVGLAWAWRTLSPKWRGEWGVSNYPSPNKSNNSKKNNKQNRQKKIIYVSDGNSDASHGEMDNERSWGHNQGSVRSFERFVQLCETVKRDNIEIYMVNIKGNPHAETYFQQCATSSKHYYLVDDIADIKIPIDDIRNGLLSELRILR